MAKVKFKRYETNSEAEQSLIEDGSFIITKEGNSYIDYDNERISTNGTPDTQMSSTSTNSVQNKVIKEYIDNKITTDITDDNLVPTSETIRNYVDNFQTYSTNETITGTWIDGSTIYRKTFSLGAQSQGYRDVPVNISSLNANRVWIIYDKSYYRETAGYIWNFSSNIGDSEKQGYDVMGRVYYDTAQRTVHWLKPLAQMSSSYLTIEYTKTTD